MTEKELANCARPYYLALQFPGVPKATPLAGAGVLEAGRLRLPYWETDCPFLDNVNRTLVRISVEALQNCPRIVRGLNGLKSGTAHQKYERLHRGLRILFSALRERYREDRLLQLVRSLDAVLKTPQGSGKREFVRKMGCIVVSCRHTRTVLEETYELRSASAHMHDWATVLGSKCPRTQKRVAKERLLAAELLTLHVWRQILEQTPLLNALGTDAAIDAFWNQPRKALRKAWGRPFPLQKALNKEFWPYGD